MIDCTRTPTRARTRVRARTHAHANAHKNAHAHARAHACARRHTRTHAHACTRTHTHLGIIDIYDVKELLTPVDDEDRIRVHSAVNAGEFDEVLRVPSDVLNFEKVS